MNRKLRHDVQEGFESFRGEFVEAMKGNTATTEGEIYA